MTKFNGFQKLFSQVRDSRHLLYYSIAERIFFFFFFLFLARKFSVDEYGMIVTAFSIANISAILFDLGIPIHLQKEISSGSDARKVIAPSTAVSIFLLPVFFFASIFTAQFAYGIDPPFMFLICLPVFLFSFANILNKILAGQSDYRSQYFAVLISRGVVFVILLILYFREFTPPEYFLYVLIIAGLLQVVYLMIKLGSVRSDIFRIFKGLNNLEMLIPVIPLGLAATFNFLYDKIDILLISKLLGFSESGIYNVSYGLYKAATITFAFLLIPALSRISNLSKRKIAVKLILEKYLRLILLITVCTAIIAATFSSGIINVIYGEKFLESSAYLAILAVALPALGLNNLFGVALNGLGMYRQNFYVTLAGLILNVVVNLLLIPEMGILGAVFATVITEYFVLALDSHYINKYLNLS